MLIKVIRRWKKETYTIGQLYVDGKYVCETLEDKDRGLDMMMKEKDICFIKIYGKTAIPTGTYQLDMNTVSPKFKNVSWAKPYGGKLPRLLAVKGYEGVLIHVGNKPEDTLGCILVGENKVKGGLINSTATFHKLMGILKKCQDPILIQIT